MNVAKRFYEADVVLLSSVKFTSVGSTNIFAAKMVSFVVNDFLITES